MISEKAFTEKDEKTLELTPLRAEMAVPSEWIVREDAHPDVLFTVFVAATDAGGLQAACSCLRGAQDLTCPHALEVLHQARANSDVLVQLFKRQHRSSAVA